MRTPKMWVVLLVPFEVYYMGTLQSFEPPTRSPEKPLGQGSLRALISLGLGRGPHTKSWTLLRTDRASAYRHGFQRAGGCV